jgi:RNA polymerase sigma-70 factor, ECF subfamily
MADAPGRLDIAQLVADHHRPVYQYAYRLTGSVQDAEDLAQQAFLIAHGKIGQLRNADAAGSWLFAILRNCFLKDRQRRRPATAVDLDLNIDAIPDDAPVADGDHDQLQNALNRLPDAFRLAVVMFYFEERSYREIADELNVPIGTVMSRLARAKDQLRAIMFESEQEVPKPRLAATAERGRAQFSSERKLDCPP